MGVPKFFRWLAKKYPTILTGCAVLEPSATNPTGEFGPRPFDNVYLDMNGILHYCAFGVTDIETATQKMHENFVSKLDTIFAAVRPTKLLFMALDGVAPRAKMNQQRTRRFMSRMTQSSAKKNAKPTVYINRPYHDSSSRDVAAMLTEDIIIKDQSTIPTFSFDSNCVTPGTEFMAQAAQWLHRFAQEKIKSGYWGPEVVIIVSDSSVPCEGEHKIIDWIRKQKHMAERSHVIYGGDADLIFLGLALHVPRIHILREGTLPKAKSSFAVRTSSRTRGKVSRDTIFVGDLHAQTTEMELGQLFESCGPIMSVRIISESHTKTTNFGFVRFGRVTASSGIEKDMTESESLEMEKIIGRALLMNGHKLRGKLLHVDRARGNAQTPMSEAEQLKILEQQELMTVEFMSMLQIEDSAIALACLNLTQWNLEEAQIIFLEYASSGLTFDAFFESRSLYAATRLSLAEQPGSSTSQNDAARDVAFSPSPVTDNNINVESANDEGNVDSANDLSNLESANDGEDAEKQTGDEENDDEEMVPQTIDSPYVLVDLAELRNCFSNRFSRVSVSDTGTVIDAEAPVKVRYEPNAQKYEPPTTPGDSSGSSSNNTTASSSSNSATDSVVNDPPSVPPVVSPATVHFRSFNVKEVMDDFILLGMLFGNDFLPGLPTQDIKTGSFNRLLEKYEQVLVQEGHLCESEVFSFQRLASVLDLVAVHEKEAVRKRIVLTRKHEIIQKRKQEKAAKLKELPPTSASEPPSEIATPLPTEGTSSPTSSAPVSPVSFATSAVEEDVTSSPSKRSRRRANAKERASNNATPSNEDTAEDADSTNLTSPTPNRARFWSGYNKLEIPEPTESDYLARRVQYYQENFPEIDFSVFSTDEEKLAHAKSTICVEYLRGICWVMRYYFTGCPSWSWFFPHHYAPFACDVADQLRAFVSAGETNSQIFSFETSEPLQPLEQLVAVLPPDSAMILPRALRSLLTDTTSQLFEFLPSSLGIQKSDGLTAAVAKWHGVLRLPFMPVDKLKQAIAELMPKLDLADVARNTFCQNIAYFADQHPLYDVCTTLTSPTGSTGEVTSSDDALRTSQQIIDSLFEMPMSNVSASPLWSGPFITLMFDVRASWH